ncbi:hypothetical protein SpCBS45565_g01669 [Spizellomyces sp. 'palustris']|nr:hypothetical protein SpCBS45565_g01669 [Spizellomyces sp. 'palustris']
MASPAVISSPAGDPSLLEEKRCHDQAVLVGASASLFAFVFTVFRRRPGAGSALTRSPNGMALIAGVTTAGGYGVYRLSYERCKERAAQKSTP